jgi:plastocyanin
VVWLTPVSSGQQENNPPRSGLRLVQKNKNFEPHLLVVPVGTVVEFPNHDPFFHNVFSLFEGKRFDLGLYEAGSSRNVRFDRVGVSYIFCNIHPQMSAVIISLDTPYYAISDRSGGVAISDVPPGRYMLHVWHERASQDYLKGLTREVTISADHHTLDELRIEQSQTLLAHKNKYGRDYDPTDSQGAYKPQ